MLSRALAGVILAAALAPPAIAASVNAGGRPASEPPFAATEIASFDTPWAIAFLPDGRMLVTEKGGALFVVNRDGRKTPVDGVPDVQAGGQNGFLDVAPAPDYLSSRLVYLTYVEPGDGGALALARAKLTVAGNARGAGGSRGDLAPDTARRWRPAGRHHRLCSGRAASLPDGRGSQCGRRARRIPTPHGARCCASRWTGSTPADNPQASAGGVRGETWSTGHRNPYGLAFDAKGQLWLNEMGPRGGDELNRIEPGSNYGWPEVSNGDNYSGTRIPRHATRPDFAAPAVYWTPVIAPAGLAFYDAGLFPAWRGSALIGGLAASALVRVTFDGAGNADEAERFDMGARIRDVAVGPDGAVYVIEDDAPGRLLRLTPR